MEKYKPGYMGKIMPADDKDKMTDFIENKYESFNKIYDVCKDVSENIKDISTVDFTEKTAEMSVKVDADLHTIATIQDIITDNASVKMTGSVISVS